MVSVVGLLTRGLSSWDTASLPTVLRLARLPGGGLRLSTVPKTGSHVQPPTFKFKEEAELARWQGPRPTVPSAEAELQRAMQVGPDLSPTMGQQSLMSFCLGHFGVRVDCIPCFRQTLGFRRSRKVRDALLPVKGRWVRLHIP